jgi:hypothetical protein
MFEELLSQPVVSALDLEIRAMKGIITFSKRQQTLLSNHVGTDSESGQAMANAFTTQRSSWHRNSSVHIRTLTHRCPASFSTERSQLDTVSISAHLKFCHNDNGSIARSCIYIGLIHKLNGINIGEMYLSLPQWSAFINFVSNKRRYVTSSDCRCHKVIYMSQDDNLRGPSDMYDKLDVVKRHCRFSWSDQNSNI